MDDRSALVKAFEFAYRRSFAGDGAVWEFRARHIRDGLGLPKNQDQDRLLVYRMVGWPMNPHLENGEPPGNAILIPDELKHESFTDGIRHAAKRTLIKEQELGAPGEPVGVGDDAAPPSRTAPCDINSMTGRDGAKWKLNELAGRCIGFSDLWFPWSRLAWCTDEEALAHVRHRYQQECNVVLYGFSTWHRPEMNERPFHGLDSNNRQRVMDRAGLFQRTGHAIVAEGFTFEYGFGHKHNRDDQGFLKSDPDRILDYLEEMGQLLAQIPNVICAFPYREMNLGWRDKPHHKPRGDRSQQVDVRLNRYRESLAALKRGIGDADIAIGLHTTNHEPPPHQMIPGSYVYFMAQTRFDLDAHDEFEWEDDDHKTRRSTNKGWCSYWGNNRWPRRIIAAEHSINKLDERNPWSKNDVHDVARALRVGQHHLESEHVVCDLSGGARKR